MAEKDRKSKKRKLLAVVVQQNSKHDHADTDADAIADVEAQIQSEATAGHRKSLPKRSQRGNMDTSQHEAENELAQAKRPGLKNSKAPAEQSSNTIDLESQSELNTSKPSAVFKPTKGRSWTLSIALPGSIINNTKSFPEKTYLAGRIARAAAVFAVDEVIIFDDAPTEIPSYLKPKVPRRDITQKSKAELLRDVAPEDEPWQNPDQFLYHLLSFLETPPNLRETLFRVHPNLAKAGQLPSMDMPHHMRSHEWRQYREGITIASPEPEKRKNKKLNPMEDEAECTFVDAGLAYPVKIPHSIPEETRVTLKFANPDAPPSWPTLSRADVDSLDVQAMSPAAPREEAGYYWGYLTRRAESLSVVYQDCPFEAGYDLTIGTSERGAELSSILPGPVTSKSKDKTAKAGKLPDRFNHLLLVFGGVGGLEPAIVGDPQLKEHLTKDTAGEAFDMWVNLVPNQGSRTIRTEEAVWLGLMGIWDYVQEHGMR
ncbi:deoxyribose-phosphate aldolase 2 [Polyplosphaeria fusca]|uniref:Deoxyribose-phosphate aldolase 2 n=1 Tax=Polyplosphaeria fusca TaxID=682080 RepID=A0A9P4V3D5_9PLEO|nr:deoxyribose-phosphate aldolase 2 [Polyplosphaeria fusca]